MQSYHTDAPSIRDFFARNFAQLDLVEMRAAEGLLGGGLDAKLVEADQETVRAWADMMFERFDGREYLGCADHLLAVVRK